MVPGSSDQYTRETEVEVAAALCRVTERAVRRWVATSEARTRVLPSERRLCELEYRCRFELPVGAPKDARDRAIDEHAKQHPRPRRQLPTGREPITSVFAPESVELKAKMGPAAPARRYVDQEDEEEQARLRLALWIERKYGLQDRARRS